MTEDSCIEKISCLAVLRAGYTGDNYLLAHMRLVLFLIWKNNYATIEVQKLVDDFYREFKYKIDYFPMRKILSLATDNGYITRKHNMKKYYCTEKINDFSNIGNEVQKNNQLFIELAQEYSKFCKIQEVEYSEQQAEEIISAYIHSQKLEHITGHIKTEGFQDKRIDYLFGKFIYYIKDQNPTFFDFLNSLVIGSILVDCLVFHDQIEDDKQLEGLTIILDTSPVFIALGIDLAGREPYYLNLFSSLKSKGAHLAMFQHSYDEMQQVINGAKYWVDNIEFDPIKASITAEYFRDKGTSKTEIDDFSISLKQKISDLGIEILNISYDSQNHLYHIDEEELRQNIMEAYRSSNRPFDKMQQERTIELDVKSIAFLYYLRKEQKPYHIHDANYIFITTNQQIAKVAEDYHSSHNTEKTLPTTLTDVFLGTYIWLSNPIQIAEMNAQQIVAHAYMAFQPSTQILEKLSESIESLLAEGTMPSALCYALRGNKFVAEKLAQKTLNDPDAYTEKTAIEIIEEFKAEAAAEERKRNMELLVKQEKESDEKLRANKQELLEETRKLLKYTQEKVDSMQKKIEIAEKTKTRWKMVLITFLVVLGLMLIAGIVSFFINKGEDLFSNVLGLICTIIPILVFVLTFIYYLCTQKDFSPKKMVDRILSNIERKKLSKLAFSSKTFEELKNQEALYNDKIQTIEKELQR